jgi:hypothetical protein
MFLLTRLSTLKTILLAGCFVCLLVSCKKYVTERQFPASLTIVNAINDNSSMLSPYFGEDRPKFFFKLIRLNSGYSYQYGTEKTDQSLKLFLNNDTLPKDRPILEERIKLEAGEIYTHFIYGSLNQLKEKTIKESIPGFSMNDSVTNLRVINLFENRSIDVVQIEPTIQTIASNLKYEELTDFIRIPFTSTVISFRFEIRDHITGTVLTSFYAPAPNIPGLQIAFRDWLYRSRTLTVTGKWNDASSFTAKVSDVRHF